VVLGLFPAFNQRGIRRQRHNLPRRRFRYALQLFPRLRYTPLLHHRLALRRDTSGTNHAWSNRPHEPAWVAFILVGATPRS